MSSGISNFNSLTGLAYNNPEFPRVGSYSCNACHSSGGGSECCIPIGGIINYQDTTATFPLTVGGATWELCNGNNGTPNLIDKFVRGTVTSAQVGTPIPLGADSYTLSTAQLPQHDHTIPGLSLDATTVVSNLAITGNTAATTSVAHTHYNCSGSDGFAYWVGYAGTPPNTSGTQFKYGGSGLTLNGNDTSACPAYTGSIAGGDIAALGNTTGDVAGLPADDLTDHTHPAGSLVLGNGAVSGSTVSTETTGNAGSSATIHNIPEGVLLYYIMRVS
jgi:hypothetical protein